MRGLLAVAAVGLVVYRLARLEGVMQDLAAQVHSQQEPWARHIIKVANPSFEEAARLRIRYFGTEGGAA